MRRHALAALALAATATLAGCGEATDANAVASPPSSTPTPTPVTGPEATSYPYDDYSYVLRVSCYCPEANAPILVTVEGGKVTAAVYAKDSDTHKKGDAAPEYQWITLNKIIKASHDEDAARVDVKWPADQAYPNSVYIDQDEMMADEEVGYAISNVTPG